jgi:hypothetical protein
MTLRNSFLKLLAKKYKIKNVVYLKKIDIPETLQNLIPEIQKVNLLNIV